MSKTYFSGICAGFLIGIGGIIYLTLKELNPFLGALLFSFGLYFIIANQYSLYTGKIGYTLDNKPSYLYKVLLPTLLGNITGTAVCAFLVCGSNKAKNLCAAAQGIMEKANGSLISSFILAFFCGLIMYLAVDVGKRTNGIERVFTIVVSIMVFILAGFNHSIADSFYFFMADFYSNAPRFLLYLVVVIAGNFFGGIFFPLLKKLL